MVLNKLLFFYSVCIDISESSMYKYKKISIQRSLYSRFSDDRSSNSNLKRILKMLNCFYSVIHVRIQRLTIASYSNQQQKQSVSYMVTARRSLYGPDKIDGISIRFCASDSYV